MSISEIVLRKVKNPNYILNEIEEDILLLLKQALEFEEKNHKLIPPDNVGQPPRETMIKGHKLFNNRFQRPGTINPQRYQRQNGFNRREPFSNNCFPSSSNTRNGSPSTVSPAFRSNINKLENTNSPHKNIHVQKYVSPAFRKKPAFVDLTHSTNGLPHELCNNLQDVTLSEFSGKCIYVHSKLNMI